MLESLFSLKEYNTTVRREILAGVTTYLAMSYILFINPAMLAQTGMDLGAVFTATCLSAMIGSILMGLIANMPIGLAPGMGLNAFFTYTVVLHMNYTWQVALGAVFLSALMFFILSISGIRRWLIRNISMQLRAAIAAGIGLFMGLIALQNAGVIKADASTMVGLGELSSRSVLLALLGLLVIVALEMRKVHSSVILSIAFIALANMLMDYYFTGNLPNYGIIAKPPDLTPTLLQLDIQGALNIGLVSVVFAFLFVDVFDNTGTLIGVIRRTGLMDKYGKGRNIDRALIADSSAAMVGSLLGTSTTTSFVESAAGVSVGGRTGLTAVVVGGLFFLSLFFFPLVKYVPLFATSPALFFIAVLMLSSLVDIDWEDLSTALPVTITVLAMPFTYSIANGIAFGIISWTFCKIVSGRYKELNLAMFILAILFLIKLAWF